MSKQLNEFKNFLIRKYAQSKTVKNYYDRIVNFYNLFDEYNQENVNNYLTNLANQNKISANHLSAQAFTQYNEFLDININIHRTNKSIKKTQKQSLTFEEIEKEILPYFPRLFEKDIEKRIVVFKFMILSMLRISEVSNLKKDKINFKNEIMFVMGKGNKERCVPIHDEIINQLKKYYEQSHTKYVFNISNNYIEYMIFKINNELNYHKKLTPHSLRHTGAKLFYKQTNDVRALQKILGHSSLETTQRYIEYDIADIKDCYKKFKYIK